MTISNPFVASVDEFKSERILVTGGTKGIGEAILCRFELSGVTAALKDVRQSVKSRRRLSIGVIHQVDRATGLTEYRAVVQLYCGSY